MNSKEFITEDEAAAFANTLIEDDNTVDVIDLNTGIYLVRWVKNKKFTTYDNKEFTDEVWSTQDGTMICVQDLAPEHARNIVRMILRNSRAMALELADIIEEALDDSDDTDSSSKINTLH